MSEDGIKLKAIKLGLLGDSTVGKTSICQSLMNIEFTGDNITTVGFEKLDTKFKLNNGKYIKLVLWDTAGQERFQSIALNTIRSVHGIVIVFDLTNRESFKNVNLWLEKIKEIFEYPRIILLGNKADINKEKWQVSSEEAKKYAEKLNLKYFKTSAKTKQGINEGFSYIINDAYDKIASKKNKNIEIGKNTDVIKEKSGGCFGKKKNKKNNKISH